MSDPNPYASPQVVETRPRTRRARAQSVPGSLWGTYAGLSLIFYGVLISSVSMVVLTFAIITDLFFLTPVGLGIYLGMLLVSLGPFFCLTVPEESRAKGFIVGSVVCMVAGVALCLLFGMALAGASMSGVIVGAFLAVAVTLASVILFVLFLVRLARYLGRSDLAKLAWGLLSAGTVLAGLIVTASISPWGAVIGMAVGAIVIDAIATFILSILLLHRFRKALKTHSLDQPLDSLGHQES